MTYTWSFFLMTLFVSKRRQFKVQQKIKTKSESKKSGYINQSAIYYDLVKYQLNYIKAR